MSKNRALSCRRVRDMLQDLHDKGVDIGADMTAVRTATLGDDVAALVAAQAPAVGEAQAALLGVDAAAHLAGCRECASFQLFLFQIGEDVRAAVEEPLIRLPVPHYASILGGAEGGRAGRKHHPPEVELSPMARRILLPAMAALFVAGIGVSSGFLASSVRHERMALRENMDYFIDNLFSSSLLDGAEYWSAGAEESHEESLEGWLEKVGSRWDSGGAGTTVP